MKKSKKKHGLCQLTGRPGFFVDSHILPISLTRLSRKGEKVSEVQLDATERLRFNGWYDSELVIRAGEDILAAIDSDGIDELRKHQLVWSAFEEGEALSGSIKEMGRPSCRVLQLGDAKELRLFFLSLLWRAAASRRNEFREIELNPSKVTDLRERLVAQDPGMLEDFPIQLFQIVTKGVPHNRSPILERKAVSDLQGAEVGSAAYARIYLQGLVAHVHIDFDGIIPEGYLLTCLGNSDGSIVFTHSFEDSRTYRDMMDVAENQHALR